MVNSQVIPDNSREVRNYRRLGRKALNSVLGRRGPVRVVHMPWAALDKCLV